MPDVVTIAVEQVRNMLQHGESAHYVDVRDEQDFVAAHVAGFKNLPLTALIHQVSSLDKAIPVILLCANGKKARLAASLLQSVGFADIKVVAGGLLAWTVHLLPLAVVV